MEQNSSKHILFGIRYKDGNFVPEFYATQYDWNAENIPSNLQKREARNRLLLQTVFDDIRVKYTLKGGASRRLCFDDSVETLATSPAKDNLQPVYSKQYKNRRPAGKQGDSLDKAYKRVDVTYENFYNKTA